MSSMFAWLFDYAVTPDGLEMRLFARWPLYRLRWRDLVGVRTINGIFGAFTRGAQPWNTVGLGNRVRWTWVLVEKRRRPRFLGITPKAPEDFVREIERVQASLPGASVHRAGGV
jgi:hypothetical protein